ncbi:MAG: ribonuclease III [Clostridiales bacterium]|jgi:ribonuclease-3|nr:ribonuclease III [Clostridiales bacterium]
MGSNIGYNFKNKELYELAFTHISYANEKNIESNQRLEFLGDSILSFVISDFLYREYADLNEGELTKRRSWAVCEHTLAEIGRNFNLSSILKLGKSEIRTGGCNKISILADTLEALIGAIFLDSDIETVKKWIIKFLNEKVEHFELNDYKSKLQIYIQKKYKAKDAITYNIKKQLGPDHDPYFVIEAVYCNKVIGVGEGKNKKQAEQSAAKRAIEYLEQ